MFRYFGAKNVRILNGGFKKWVHEHRKTASGQQTLHVSPVSIGVFDYKVADPEKCILDINEIYSVARDIHHKKTDVQIVDARSAGRFNGTAPEPRPGLRGGHIAGSLNLPFNLLINDDGTFKSDEEIATAFKEAGVDISKPILNSCGTGVTAAVVSLGADLLGSKNNRLYDGSWSEYG